MNIYYMDNTLFINLNEYIDTNVVSELKSKVFNILDDYDIENIVLNIISDNKNNSLLDDFINSYHSKYNGKLLIKF